MKIKRISLFIKCAIPMLLFLLVVLIIMLVSLIGRTSQLREDNAKLVELGNDVMWYNDQLIKVMERFFIGYDEAVLREYDILIADESALFGKFDEMKVIGISAGEERIINSILGILDKLAGIEDRAIDAYRAGNLEEARAIILSNDYKNTDKELYLQTKALIDSFTERIDADVSRTVNQGIVWLVVVFSIIFLIMASMIPLMNWFFNKLFWYDSIIDSIPQPISVTDMNRKTTLVNKSVENLLGKSKGAMVGVDCGQVWNAPICNTPECGIECLKRGKPETIFSVGEVTFRVEASYLTNSNGHKIGHIEVVNDITHLMQKQKGEAELVKNIQGMSDSFITQTKGIVNDSQAIAQGSTEQAAAVQQLSSIISQVSNKAKENAEMAEKATELSSEIKVKAEKGSHQMDDLMQAVNDITDASSQIKRVIKVIDDIAFQTNILALNAAVEAARAGNAGKGFAVVAEEVRNLASKSAEAAKNTGGLIENSVEKANLGMTIATDTASSLKEIVSGINQNAEIISRIADSSEEQTSAISEIDTGVNQVASVIQENTNKAEASASASLEMSRQMDELEHLLDNFQKGN